MSDENSGTAQHDLYGYAVAQNGIDRARGCPIPTDASRLRLPPVTLVDLYLRFDEEPCVNWNNGEKGFL